MTSSWNEDVHLVTTFVFYQVSKFQFVSSNFIVKTCLQNAKVWCKSRRCNLIWRSYVCTKPKKFIITIRELDIWMVGYWILSRNTYTHCLPLFCMFDLYPRNAMDSVTLQRILWFTLGSQQRILCTFGAMRLPTGDDREWVFCGSLKITDFIQHENIYVYITLFYATCISHCYLNKMGYMLACSFAKLFRWKSGEWVTIIMQCKLLHMH